MNAGGSRDHLLAGKPLLSGEAGGDQADRTAFSSYLDSFQIGEALTAPIWNWLKLNLFALPRARALIIEDSASRWKAALIVCSCNVLTDEDVRNAVSASAGLPRNARQVYGCLGCSAECGRCARTINKIIKDALGACARGCAAGCPHAAHHAKGREAHVSAALQVSQISAG